MSSSKQLGTKSSKQQQRWKLFILGGIITFVVVNIIHSNQSYYALYQIVNQNNNYDHQYLSLESIDNDYLELQRQENITVTRVATDLERNQTIALAKFAVETCNSMDLDIFAGFGTLLGSMRHHDFIPWDDDMDFIVVLNNWTQVMELHEVFEKRMLERPHLEFGTIGKTAPNLTPHCWTQKTCNVTEELPYGRPFLGMFRTHFMNSRVVGWRYDYNCTKEDNKWCSRWPSVDIFMFLRTDDTLSSIIGWGLKKVQYEDVYPLRDMLFHGVLFKAPHNAGNYLATYHGYPKAGYEYMDCKGGTNHRGGGKVKFSTNCTILWDQVPFVRHREQTKNNETIEIAYLNETIVSVLKLDEKGKSICHAAREHERNSCGEEFGL